MPGKNTRTAVYRVGLENPLYHVKFRFAQVLVREGRAEFIDSLSIRILPSREIVKSSKCIRGNIQGAAYESAAIDANRKYLQGGITRDEHQPKAFSRWSGAKVGHQ